MTVKKNCKNTLYRFLARRFETTRNYVVYIRIVLSRCERKSKNYRYTFNELKFSHKNKIKNILVNKKKVFSYNVPVL